MRHVEHIHRATRILNTLDSVLLDFLKDSTTEKRASGYRAAYSFQKISSLHHISSSDSKINLMLELTHAAQIHATYIAGITMKVILSLFFLRAEVFKGVTASDAFAEVWPPTGL